MHHLRKARVNTVAEPPRLCKSPDFNIFDKYINRVFQSKCFG